MDFTRKLSENASSDLVKAILHAPVDKFFDRTPVGRIMNRMSTDMINIDTTTYNHLTQLLSVCGTNSAPIVYVHVLMPLWFTVASIPFYYLAYLLMKRFWNTMVPMRYLMHISKSHTDNTLTEVEHSNAFVRASRKGNFKFKEFQSTMRNQLKAEVNTATCLRRWLVNRIYLLMGFFMCVLVILAIWVPNVIGIGAFALCLTNMYQIIASTENDIQIYMQAQFQFISMKRLHDYTMLDKEAPHEKESDKPYQNHFVKIKRANLGALERRGADGRLVIVRRTPTSSGLRRCIEGRYSRDMNDRRLLEQTDKNVFKAPQGFALLDISPESHFCRRRLRGDSAQETNEGKLMDCLDWHRLVAVNGKNARCNIEGMVQELCNGESLEVILQIESGWLHSGAHLTIRNLVAGYGDMAQNVLHNISINIQPRSKVGVVGTTGCGKSTLLLCILRILEPNGGSICLNGVDTKTLGLKTLRRTVGMVAQDPVLMQCSIRDNLDPFNEFDDEMLWKGLDMVKMKDHIESLEGRLGFDVKGDGGNLSFGQRQLICMARMVIRQPKLMLLDEATSALDPATQQQVQHTVERHFPNSTLLMIAHRLETIVNFDKVVVMEKGKIAEQGSPAELRDKEGGKFAEMWHAKTTW